MFKVKELIKATGGQRICGRDDLLVRGISIDSRSLKRREAFVAIKGDRFDGHKFIGQAVEAGSRCIIFQGARPVIHSKKVTLIRVRDTRNALGDIAGFHRRRFKIPVIAITGSNGKTTSKEMIASVLSGKFCVLKNVGTENNQIGVSQTLLRLNKKHDLAVLEIGTNHFGEVRRLAEVSGANIGLITCIGPAHLKYFGDLQGVFREKISLIRNLESPNIAILNADDPFLAKEISKKRINPVTFGFAVKKSADFTAANLEFSRGSLRFSMNHSRGQGARKFKLNTPGGYNIYNALAAVAVARILGLDYRQIASGLSGFEFPRGRLKLISVKDINFIDDTYNSNPFSLERALDALSSFKTSGRRIFVMGDMLELGGQEDLFHRMVGRKISRSCNTFIGVGRLCRLAAESAKDAGFDKENIFTCDSSEEARKILNEKISPRGDDIILVKGSRMMKMEEVFRQ